MFCVDQHKRLLYLHLLLYGIFSLFINEFSRMSPNTVLSQSSHFTICKTSRQKKSVSVSPCDINTHTCKVISSFFALNIHSFFQQIMHGRSLSIQPNMLAYTHIPIRQENLLPFFIIFSRFLFGSNVNTSAKDVHTKTRCVDP